MYQKVLVPIDLSAKESGEAALGLARKLTGGNGKIIALNVVEDIPGYVAVELPSNLMEKTVSNAQARLEDIVNASGLAASTEVRRGAAASAIISAAQEHEADLIIIASHRPGLADYFLGSTATRVVAHAKCPVLVDR